uniref:ARALKYL-CoA N-acyltransferase (Fragments) n=1 Tax=Bos taurus TaxID=9913 RepID=Q9T2U9_BOVIN
MFLLQGAQMLQMLEKMKDDLDHYTNTYHVYSEDLKNGQEFL